MSSRHGSVDASRTADAGFQTFSNIEDHKAKPRVEGGDPSLMNRSGCRILGRATYVQLGDRALDALDLSAGTAGPSGSTIV